MQLPRFLATSILAPLLGACLLLPGTARASHLHVATSGNGSCTTAASPCELDVALEEATDGDVIHLSPGSYGDYGTLQDHPGISGVTIMGEPGESRPVLDLSSGTLELIHGTNLSGVDIVSSEGRAVKVIGGRIEHVRAFVSGPNTTAFELGDGAVLRNSSVIAAGNEATAVSVTASTVPAELRGASVLASGVDATALRVMAMAPATNAAVRAVNTILRRSGAATELLVSGFGSDTASAVLDHVAANPVAQVIEGPGASVSSESQLFLPPLFVDRAIGDLRQTGDSPTIDAGTDDINGDGAVDAADQVAGGETDLDGSPRTLGVHDIGSDEREMQPRIESVEPIFEDHEVSLRVTVQPRGLPTAVGAEWAKGAAELSPVDPVTVSGNGSVVALVPLGKLGVGTTALVVRVRAGNDAGSASTTTRTVAVPEANVLRPSVATDGSGQAASVTVARRAAAPIITAAPMPSLTLPGLLPTLVAKDAFRARGRFTFRLRCRHTLACRGTVLLTRLGAVRTDSFKIPPMGTRSVELALTSSQAARVRNAGRRGLRGLLEIRSLDEGSSFLAVRLFNTRPVVASKPAGSAKP